MIDQRCMIQPIQISQRSAAATKKTSARKGRPWINWPRPGIKKLASAAITFPVDPCPLMGGVSMTPVALSSDCYACAKGIRAVNELNSDRVMPPVRYSATSSMNRRKSTGAEWSA
jgi:hypothetical protein